MHATPRIQTPLPPRPARASVAIDSTHRLLEALVERDVTMAQALFSPSACVWWSRSPHARGGGSLASVEGAPALAQALIGLLEAAPPTRLAVVGSEPRTAVTSAYVEDALAWSLEVRLEGEQIVGAFLRGATL